MAFDFQAAYVELNPADDDYRFYASLAAELQAMDVIDLGCGTGTLARLLTAAGHHVVAIDPDPEMLRVAAAKGPIDNVTWRQGFSDCADTDSADLFVMSGHVAQVFVGDDEWLRVLHDARRALRRGGVIAFESRNPDARGWEMWPRENSLRVVEESDGPVEFWHSTVEASLPTVRLRHLDGRPGDRTEILHERHPRLPYPRLLDDDARSDRVPRS